MKVYTTKKKANENKEGNKVKAICIALFWLVLWQTSSMVVGSEILLPSPWDTLVALGQLIKMPAFYLDCGATILRCALAMALSFIIGLVLGFVAHKHSIVREILKLPVSFFKAVPVMAIIIYMIILVESGWVAVLVCFLMCFPVVYTNVLSGLDSMDTDLLEVAELYKLTEVQAMEYFLLPGMMAEIKAAVSLIAGLSWKAVVAAEVLSIPSHSLGYEMINAKYYLDTASLFAYILTIILLSLAFEKAIKGLMNRDKDSEYQGTKLRYTNKETMDEVGPGPRVGIENLTKTFKDRLAIDNISMDLEPEQVNAIMGPSGAGKTTLARIIAGLEEADKGAVQKPKETKVAYLFQEDRLIPWLNVYDNMALVLACSGQMAKPGKNKMVDPVVKMARDLEIEGSLWKLPSQLSGGMRHRVAIGRTLLVPSNLIIMDEPFRGLDGDLKARIINRLWTRETQGKTVILISHNEEDCNQLAQKVIYM